MLAVMLLDIFTWILFAIWLIETIGWAKNYKIYVIICKRWGGNISRGQLKVKIPSFYKLQISRL